ncbi:unnamed protein product [Prorocentrum cordatum]|uniref:Methyltransferase type 12 domain-containing protein n=1 Tax=Prorocentrum cordatum TaxID=2364126 RepID=A0ABN9Y1B7_9DINO|nr:unnamed protein product [Polarella glacialis]
MAPGEGGTPLSRDGSALFAPVRDHLEGLREQLAGLLLERQLLEEQLNRNCRSALGGLWDLQVHRWVAEPTDGLLKQALHNQWPALDVMRAVVVEGRLEKMWDLQLWLSMILDSAQQHWGTVAEEARQMGERLAVQAKQLSVNARTLDARAEVLLGLLARTPGFESRAQGVLANLRGGLEARGQRGFDSVFSPMSKVHGLLQRVTVIATRVEESAGSLAAEMEPDWCGGTGEDVPAEVAAVSEENCRRLAAWARGLEHKMSHWLASSALDAFRSVARWQLDAAANLTAAAELLRLLWGASEGLLGDGAPPVATGGLGVGDNPEEPTVLLDSSNLEDSVRLLEEDAEHFTPGVGATADAAPLPRRLSDTARLLADGRPNQYVAPPQRPAPEPRGEPLGRRLMGLMRLCVRFQWLTDMMSLTATNWFDRVRRRGDGLLRVSSRIEADQRALHDSLQTLPEYRRLAFEEIHEAGHWGKGNSGGGSNPTRTWAVARGLVEILAQYPPGGALSVLDIGCGWGEWLPEQLRRAMAAGTIRRDLSYVGVEIASQPVQHLRAVSSSWALGRWRFEVADAVSDALPAGADVAVVRHVFQHLTTADALTLLRNLRQARPRYSGPPRLPERGPEHGGRLLGLRQRGPRQGPPVPSNYDLRSPPFALPEPDRVVLDLNTTNSGEAKDPEQMLLYPVDALDVLG